MNDVHPRVQGECPACNLTSLFLGDGGYVTCSNLECPMPDTMLAFKVKETGLPFYRRGDKLPTGEEFIGYTGDGSPMWNEPAPSVSKVLVLDDYETANLREGLLTLRELGCDTGDWLGQILNRLPASTTRPNATLEDQVGRAAHTVDSQRRGEPDWPGPVEVP